MEDFANFINHARGLTGLSLNRINTSLFPQVYDNAKTEQGEADKDTLEPHHISHLNRLDMACSDNSVFVNWLLGPQPHLGVSQIHTLHISLPETEDGSVNRLLRAIGNSLKHVSIILPRVCE
jgi:hypothetical protein